MSLSNHLCGPCFSIFAKNTAHSTHIYTHHTHIHTAHTRAHTHVHKSGNRTRLEVCGKELCSLLDALPSILPQGALPSPLSSTQEPCVEQCAEGDTPCLSLCLPRVPGCTPSCPWETNFPTVGMGPHRDVDLDSVTVPSGLVHL